MSFLLPTPRNRARRGFTLPEILVALAVIGILGAILFPVFGRARESGRQSHCASNLQNIYAATRQYREDYQGYPPSLETLLPAGTRVVATSGGYEPAAGGREEDPTPEAVTPNILGNGNESGGEGTRVVASLSYIKSLDEVVCPSDKIEMNAFSSSYGVKNGSVWNFHGYDRFGFMPRFALSGSALVNPEKPFDARNNPVKYSLGNRFAPPGTIVTHCLFHRTAGSNLKSPYDMGTEQDAGLSSGARDIVLRLDGSAKSQDVSGFKGVKDDGTDSKWRIQTF